MEERTEELVLVGGDFNMKTGCKGGGGEGMEGERSSKRNSLDGSEACKGGKGLLRILDEMGWSILNGNFAGDEEGEFTFERAGMSSVIDYVLAEEKGRERIERFEVGVRCDFDDYPLVVTVKGEEIGERKKKKRKAGVKKIKVANWEREKRGELRKRLEGVKWGEEGAVNEMLEEIRHRVKQFKEEIEEKIKRKRKGWGDWWDEECRDMKKEVRKALRRARKELGSRDEYREKKRRYSKLCEEKRAEEI
ncbi:protein PXR1-like [Diachasma alloeum]|uniref:protein PXR1-like n=1 Tax=Diachasma alloeum TaxID=454923 RepID=UPI00073849AA|nr:protein PXR1-like [Diachasma alloeum]